MWRWILHTEQSELPFRYQNCGGPTTLDSFSVLMALWRLMFFGPYFVKFYPLCLRRWMFLHWYKSGHRKQDWKVFSGSSSTDFCYHIHAHHITLFISLSNCILKLGLFILMHLLDNCSGMLFQVLCFWRSEWPGDSVLLSNVKL